MYGDNVFKARAHGVTRKAFGVTDDYVFDVAFKRILQSEYFRAGAAASGRGISFVRDKHHLFGHIGAAKPVFLFGFAHHSVHNLGDVVDVNSRRVESAVGNFRSQKPG